MKAKVLSFGLLVAVTLSITMVSSCKKENVEPVQTAVTTGNQSNVVIPKIDWGYDNTTVEGVLDAAGYRVGGDSEVSFEKGYAKPNSDYSDFKCDPRGPICYIEIRAKKKADYQTDVVIAYQNTPKVFYDVEKIITKEIDGTLYVKVIE